MESLEVRLQQLENEASIRNLVGQFADACMVADYDAFGRLWAIDGKWAIHEPFFLSSEGRKKLLR